MISTIQHSGNGRAMKIAERSVVSRFWEKRYADGKQEFWTNENYSA